MFIFLVLLLLCLMTEEEQGYFLLLLLRPLLVLLCATATTLRGGGIVVERHTIPVQTIDLLIDLCSTLLRALAARTRQGRLAASLYH